MTLDDQCVSINPYFRIPVEREQEVMELCQQFVDRSSQESLCLYYGFSKADEILHCREGYRGAAGAYWLIWIMLVIGCKRFCKSANSPSSKCMVLVKSLRY